LLIHLAAHHPPVAPYFNSPDTSGINSKTRMAMIVSSRNSPRAMLDCSTAKW